MNVDTLLFMHRRRLALAPHRKLTTETLHGVLSKMLDCGQVPGEAGVEISLTEWRELAAENRWYEPDGTCFLHVAHPDKTFGIRIRACGDVPYRSVRFAGDA